MEDINVLDVFGGANNFYEQDRLPEKCAWKIHDCNLEQGVIVPVKEDALLQDVTSVNTGHYGAINRSVVKLFGNYYWSINDALSEPYYGASLYTMGIKPPEVLPTVAEEVVAENALSGSFKYCITYVRGGFESAPFKQSDAYYVAIEVEDKGIRVTLPQNIPADVQQIKIYRTMNNDGTFYLVDYVDAGALSYLDTLSDDQLLLNLPIDSLYNYPPPASGKYLCSHDGVFFLAVDDKLFFSELANVHAWNPSNYINIDDTITAIVPEFIGVLVFTSNRVYRVTGNSVDNISKTEIPTRQGCLDYHSCATLSNAPMWISNDGLCTWNGQSIILLSHGKYKIPNDYKFAVSANDKYYLFCDTQTIVYDQRNSGIFYSLSNTANYGWYDVDVDRIYLSRNNVIYVMEGGKKNKTATIETRVYYPGSYFSLRMARIEALGKVVMKTITNKGVISNNLNTGTKRIRNVYLKPYKAFGFKIVLHVSEKIYSCSVN